MVNVRSANVDHVDVGTSDNLVKARRRLASDQICGGASRFDMCGCDAHHARVEPERIVKVFKVLYNIGVGFAHGAEPDNPNTDLFHLIPSGNFFDH